MTRHQWAKETLMEGDFCAVLTAEEISEWNEYKRSIPIWREWSHTMNLLENARILLSADEVIKATDRAIAVQVEMFATAKAWYAALVERTKDKAD